MTKSDVASTATVAAPKVEGPLLPRMKSPADLKALAIDQLPQLAEEIRQAICDQVSKTGGHLVNKLKKLCDGEIKGEGFYIESL